jgi:DNA-directed RNA polymerase subunit RPC12/RpoP
MSLINLLCPHCGGNFELDPDRSLQSFWVCPYCGNRSLMQKNEDTIRLRGIIPGRSSVTGPGMPVVSSPLAADPLTDYLTAASNMPVSPRPLSDVIAEASAEPTLSAAVTVDSAAPADQTEPTPPPAMPTESKSAPVAEARRPETPGQPARITDELDHLCQKAEEAAKNRDFPLFNAYSRQALDCQPKDPRMYALRADLTEEADGFARATWNSLGWSLLTPRRKSSLIAQHLYNFNTALKYSRPNQQHELIDRMAWHLVRQAIEIFSEQGELRCKRRMVFKTFKGRFKRRDLEMGVYFLDAVHLITKQICPIAHQDLLDALRTEIRKAPPRIARRLKKV